MFKALQDYLRSLQPSPGNFCSPFRPILKFSALSTGLPWKYHHSLQHFLKVPLLSITHILHSLFFLRFLSSKSFCATCRELILIKISNLFIVQFLRKYQITPILFHEIPLNHYDLLLVHYYESIFIERVSHVMNQNMSYNAASFAIIT